MSNKIFYSFLALSLVLISFTGCKPDDEKAVPAPETGTVTDFDGNTYQTVKIGNQWWMAENLKVTHYRNGVVIPNMTNNLDWSSSTSGGSCYLNNNIKTYGMLYNWFAVNDTNRIAPAGWHVAGDGEWKDLEKHLGMSASEADKSGWRGTHEGEKLKMEGNAGWSAYEGVWATNESGFSAEAGACRLFDGNAGEKFFATGFWWTSSISADSSAWYRYLDYKNTNVFRAYDDRHYGFSIRCVKD